MLIFKHNKASVLLSFMRAIKILPDKMLVYYVKVTNSTTLSINYRCISLYSSAETIISTVLVSSLTGICRAGYQEDEELVGEVLVCFRFGDYILWTFAYTAC